MTLPSELQSLTLVAIATILMWVPYTVARIVRRGLWAALANPDPLHPADPAWAERARRAHANAVENLAVFAPLVLVITLLGASTQLTAAACTVYLLARLVHYVVYAAGIPVVRTLAFVVGVAATLVVAAAVLGQAA